MTNQSQEAAARHTRYSWMTHRELICHLRDNDEIMASEILRELIHRLEKLTGNRDR